jgi:hypothetical protein
LNISRPALSKTPCKRSWRATRRSL